MKGGEKMAVQEGIKNLKVFSKKLNSIVDVFASQDQLVPAIQKASWLDNGWNNYSGSWMNNGWNNYSGSWANNGWNNYSGSWMNNGWNNSGGSWSNSGWSNSSGGGGCYITTAAVNYFGLEDNCDELNMLRMYRDKLVEEDPKFRKVVLEYYKTAPQIVEKISNSPDKDAIFNNIYTNMVLPVLELLKDGKINDAKDYYISAYNNLKSNYILEPQKQLVKSSSK